MFGLRFKPLKYTAQITVDGHNLPVEIIIERRNGTRFSIGKKAVMMRLMAGITSEGISKELRRLEGWVTELHHQKPDLLLRFKEKTYQTGQEIVVGTRKYRLEVREEDCATHTARLVGDTIAIRLSTKASAKHQQKAVQTLLSRVVGNDYLAEITARVKAINAQTVQQPISKITLKHNHSNWGSCSSKGNVNLSTRLLFAPQDVQDYVILHELAHLVELNHSDRFWAIVSRFMPNYEEKEHWLKVNGNKCHF